ncbi:T9SS type A sorting domain-containing protein [Porphyromonas circumdentaria]|uniref:Por secretion system C-terminal sorting domain-containing protein n=1 Tax=Porphyromonas circumdentaria TaxID=29524 RepID=A0A1T4MQF9_9PORP|nr:T9SS type A sorting domain-containing protein [Porphyromonas circumdentaria]MBB6275913.1 hypothetical protein [Porphyromonas circumdentaria]SJZ69289.1 Por secretion system C-terminal sorting domain-containing protein [Porphyromonas circumdentaria]
MKHKFQFWSLSLLLLLTSAIGYAQQAVRPAAQMLSSNGPAEVTPSREARIEGNYSYVDFDVEAPVSQEYYISFWVNPYLDIEGNLPTYHVFVDGRACGLINPTSPDPHSVNISTDKVYLSSGKHQISVRAVVPDIAGVELMKVSNTAPSARLSSSAYSEYLQAVQDIQAGRITAEEYLSTKKTSQALSSNQEQENKLELLRTSGDFFPLTPVPYTFRTSRYYDSGRQVIISTRSTIPHVVYLVSAKVNQAPLINQGLTWLRFSSVIPGSGGDNTALFSITIPQDGTYMIVIRALYEDSFGTVDVNLNQQEFHSNRPISFSYIPVSQPRNTRLLSMTITPKPDTDANLKYDPFLFVLGGGSCPGLIVQYNDDVVYDSLEKEFYGLKRRDSFIDATYLIPTCGLLVANYGTQTPLFYCNTITNLPYQNLPPLVRKSTLETTQEGKETCVSIELRDYYKKTITLSSQEVMNTIEVFSYENMNLVGRKELKQSGEITIPITELGITSSGLYIVRVTNDKGIISQKIIL